MRIEDKTGICKTSGKLAVVTASMYLKPGGMHTMENDEKIVYVVSYKEFEQASSHLIREETKLEKLMRGKDE